jgi:hypothetical protein
MSDSQSEARLAGMFAPVLDEMERQAAVTDRFVDRDVYRILMATLWVNVVLDPGDVGLTEADLEPAHDLLSLRIGEVLGGDESLTSCFRFLNSKAGERAMGAARISADHRDLLLYFASIILDPDGHRRWMEDLQARPSR